MEGGVHRRSAYSLFMPTSASAAHGADDPAVNETFENSTFLTSTVSVGYGIFSGSRFKDVETVFLILIILASLIANSMVFYIFYRKPSLLTISNRFVLNLTIGNFLITILLMPIVLGSHLAEEWGLGEVYCTITGVLTTLLFTACVLSLLLISLDRYHAIIKPFRYSSTITSTRATLFIILVWVISCIIALPPVVGLGHISYQQDKSMCTVEWASPSVEDRIYALGVVVLCFVLPLSLMIWIYVNIFRAVQRTSALARNNSIITDMGDTALTQQMIAQAAHQQRRRSSMASLVTQINAFRRRSSIGNRSILSLHRGDQKAAKTGMMVLSTFVVCWLPFYIVIVTEAATARPDLVPQWIQVTCTFMIFTGCALNPIVYVFRSKPIKLELLNALRFGRQGGNGNEANGSLRENSLRENGIMGPRHNGCHSNGSLRQPLTPNNSAASITRQSSDPTHCGSAGSTSKSSSVAFSIAPPGEV